MCQIRAGKRKHCASPRHFTCKPVNSHLNDVRGSEKESWRHSRNSRIEGPNFHDVRMCSADQYSRENCRSRLHLLCQRFSYTFAPNSADKRGKTPETIKKISVFFLVLVYMCRAWDICHLS